MSPEAGVVTLADGGRLAYVVSGLAHGGTPALLLRPLAGAMAMWGAFRERLAERLTVVAFDPRGVGGSSDAPIDVTTRAMAGDALALLVALGFTRAHVFGISLGAMVATWLAADAPARIERLCLASAGPEGVALTVAGGVHLAEVAAAALAPGDDVVARVAEAVLSPEARDPAQVEAVEAAAEAEPARRGELLKLALAAARHDARDVLHRITAPTLVLAGERDDLVDASAPRALAAAIAGARFEVVADAGHDLTLERPDAVARRAADFFLAR